MPLPKAVQPFVPVVDVDGKPLMPCHPARARKLRSKGRAVVHSVFPYAIRMLDRKLEDSAVQPVDLMLDPGSKTTGLALCRVEESTDPGTGETAVTRHALVLGEIVHRGQAIHKAMGQRKGYRRRRRSKNLRYRAPRFDNRRRPEGWLPPSLNHRVLTVGTQVSRWSKLVPLRHVHVEGVRFDMQALENPDISGEEYQNGTLAGWEAWEYLLERDGRQCAYCGKAGVPLEREHVRPRSKGGSDRVSNMVCACRPCNRKKDATSVEEFLAEDPERLAKIKARLKAPLRDAAAVNSTRKALVAALEGRGFAVSSWTGGRTKFNRTRLGVPKAHSLDALCVGPVDTVPRWHMPVLRAGCAGRGRHCRTLTDAQGFPVGYRPRTKTVHGFRTGDMVRAVVAEGKKAGTYVGRIAVRASGSFNIGTPAGVVQGISWKTCKLLQRADGYAWSTVPLMSCLQDGRPKLVADVSIPPRPEGRGFLETRG